MAELPPRDTWIACANSVTRWRAVVDSIQVAASHPGVVMLSINNDGRRQSVRLDPDAARSLARLLQSTADELGK